jgi:hypothetical protein
LLEDQEAGRGAYVVPEAGEISASAFDVVVKMAGEASVSSLARVRRACGVPTAERFYRQHSGAATLTRSTHHTKITTTTDLNDRG